MFFGSDPAGREREDSIITSFVGFGGQKQSTSPNSHSELKMQREIKELS